MKKRKSFFFLIFCLATALMACGPYRDGETMKAQSPSAYTEEESRSPEPKETEREGQSYGYKDSTGMTLESRVLVPEGYERVEGPKGSLLAFMRGMELKEDGSPILLYNGQERGNQSAAFAVFAMDVGERDLQQCADSVMRIYAEYDWQRGDYESIVFPFGNGFSFDYATWRKGGRISVKGNDVRWQQTAGYDDSYECFRKYLTVTFAYAGTASLSTVCQKIALEDMQAGDLFLKGGSPGHCVLLVDEAADREGHKCFLLAQGFMPAQDFHVLTNPLHPEDPWYYEEELSFPVKTPQYMFEEGTACRFRDFQTIK